jgi:parallel beta-helix repeat protein
VEHLVFRDLTFSHAEWWFPERLRADPQPEVGGFAQAAVGVPGAIYAEGARDLAFDRCTVAHVGTYAIELGRGCQRNRVATCRLFDLGAGGVKIGETALREEKQEQTHGNMVTGCHIHDGGRIFHSAVGIWIGQSFDNRLARNHVHDFYYTGFSVGWTWGYGAALAQRNIVEENHVHHIGVRSDGDGPILSDMGGIYTLGSQPGTVIRGNRFHDIAGLRYGGWGIYLDEGSSQIVVEKNLVYRTTHGGFHQHYGRENLIRNNIFALGRDAQIQRTRSEPHRSFTFERNIVYWREGSLLAGDLSNLQFLFDRNLYWREADGGVGRPTPGSPAGPLPGGEVRFGDWSWDAWREKGMDRNSRVADPLFVAIEKDDWRLRPNSPAFRLGFVAIDVATGPARGSP